ncbi:hypothetical protein ACGFNU_08860 [Spirillospora sp. NPDC048911]|uniref:hypothetical protein n=1 Tax=Spirillospora sp. NPDC048911 TaxID=3364527 RepID=UPI003719C72F
MDNSGLQPIEETWIPTDDLSLREGVPTGQSDPVFITELVLSAPVGRSSTLCLFGFVVASGVGCLGVTAGVGRWVNAPATLVLISSISVFLFVVGVGAVVLHQSSRGTPYAGVRDGLDDELARYEVGSRS